MSFEIGQRILFRSLHWEVAENSSEDVVELFGRSRENQGQRMRVIVGVEPMERAEMPALVWTLGDPNWRPLDWKALHDAYRLTLSHGRGNLIAVDWGRLILEPYQLVPLRRIESLPYPRLLLADDTGLGKTAEAGLILFRLMQRRRADRVLVLTRARPEPERWQQELRDKFGIEARVINNGQDFARLRRETPAHLNVFAATPRIIMSMHFAAQDHIVDDLRRGVRWDVVIIDEAHHFADRGSGKNLTELARVVADSSEALLLLTATPHDGKGESFASLIRLLDPYAVVDPERLDPAIVRPLVVRRLKTDVVKADGSRFIKRKITVVDVERFRTKEERHLERGLRDYTRLLQERAEDLEALGERNLAMGATFLETFLRKRLASSAYACGASLKTRLEKIGGQIAGTSDEETPEDASQQPVFADAIDLPGEKSEAEILRDLITRANKIPEGSEGKVHALIEFLKMRLQDPREKVVIFTEFLDTLKMLYRVLEHEGWKHDTDFVTYHGATPAHERENIRTRFMDNPKVRIFLATDAASEGINLQKACKTLAHLEIPWNPNRYEQRNGRIDRYGQNERPEIFLFVATKSLEQRVAQIVVEKLERIAEDVGSVSNVFPLTNKVNVDEFLARANPDAVDAAAEEMNAQLDQAVQDAREKIHGEVSEELVRGEQFSEHDLREVERELAAAREFIPEFSDVEEFLRTFLRSEDVTGNDGFETTAQDDVYSLRVPRSLQSEVGRDKYLRVTFRRDLAVAEQDRDDAARVEFLSPGHPLVRAALRRMRGKIFAAGFASRVSFRRTPPNSDAGFFFTYALRFVDARGETIEERFEAVRVNLDGRASHESENDLRVFVERAPLGSISPAEEKNLLPRFREKFDAARSAADVEIERRQQARVRELEHAQRDIASDGLKRLGAWKLASEQRLRQRFGDVLATQQLDLFKERERRIRQFDKEQENLLKDEARREAEIRAMELVRGDSIDAIGALVLIPLQA